jgi:hypothetical protein
VRAQQRAMPVIGFLNGGSAAPLRRQVSAFHQGLQEAGYVEGQNVAVDYRFAEGQFDRLKAMAEDLVRRQVSVITAPSVPAALAAKRATTTIPTVFSIGDDPVKGFFLPVRVLSRLFRRLFLDKLVAAHRAAELQFFNGHAALVDPQSFAAFLAPLRNSEWVVYSKRPFGGPKEVLRYLARYTHRVAISNRRLIACGKRPTSKHSKKTDGRVPPRPRRMVVQPLEYRSGCPISR